jgi:hypothetical protein
MSQQVTHRAGLDRSGPGLIYRSSLAFTRLARLTSWGIGRGRSAWFAIGRPTWS